jgi:type I restriction enzyme R subunit
VARNHQVLSVNRAVASVLRQEELKQQFPPGERLIAYCVPKPELLLAAEKPQTDSAYAKAILPDGNDKLPLAKRAQEDLGRLGVFWHTQGSGKSYSMAFFTEKVRRVVPGNFTFLVMTDREDLDDQIRRTLTGCGVADEKTPRAASGKALKAILRGNHRFVFSRTTDGPGGKSRRRTAAGG